MQFYFFFPSSASNWVQWEIDLLWNSNEPDHIPDKNPPSRSQNCCQECELLGRSDNNDATDRRVFGWCLLGEVLCNSWFFHHLSYGNLHIYALLISHWVHGIFTWWATLMKIDWRCKLGPSSTSWFLMLLWWSDQFWSRQTSSGGKSSPDRNQGLGWPFFLASLVCDDIETWLIQGSSSGQIALARWLVIQTKPTHCRVTRQPTELNPLNSFKGHRTNSNSVSKAQADWSKLLTWCPS